MLTYSVAFGLEYPSGFTFIEVPDPLSGDNPTYPLISRSVPAIGEPFFDSRFGTILTRVTQVDELGARHEYSRFDPFNKDQSMIILLPEYDWRVYRTQTFPYNQEANLVTVLHHIAEPRWDPNDPNLVWGLQDFQLLTVNVLGGTTIIKDFANDPTIKPILQSEPDLYRITMKDEGESSQDKQYWAFFLQGSNEDYRVRYIFTWDRLQDKILGLYKIPLNESDIDWVGMSALGNWVLIGGQPDNGGNLIGLTMANKELTQFHQLDYATAHSDVGLDTQGNEVIVMQNVQTDYIDLIPIDLSTKVVTNANDYPGSNRTRLIRLYYNNQSSIGLNSGVHISCNVPGYCVISTTTRPNVPEQNWLDRTITLVKLNRSNPRVFYLAKVYNTTGTYWEETHATITNDGKKVVWAENWGQYVQEGQTPKNFLMQLDMPKTRDEIMGAGGTWSSGIWYYNLATMTWSKPYGSTPSGPIAVGDINGDGKAEMVSCWPSGLWYQDGATWGWTKVSSVAPSKVAVGDITGDRRAEIIGVWSSGIWYWNPATSLWTNMYSSVPSGAIAAGDVTGDGRADVVSVWPSGLWYQDGATWGWTKVSSVAPSKVAVGDITGDRRAEIIGVWSSGIWYWNPATNGWTQMYSYVPSGPIAAGDVTGDGKADVVSCWPSGLWYQDGATLNWTKVYSTAPSKIAVGDITGN